MILDAMAPAAAMTYRPDPLGLLCARRALAQALSSGLAPDLGAIDPDRILLTASTSEGYSHLFTLLCDPGDEVLVPQPSYPLFELLARFDDVRLVPYRLAFDGAWHMDLASVREGVGPRTRAILVVNPNNPTGSFLKRAELSALLSLGLPIVSDEVFARYPIDVDAPRVTTLLEARAHADLMFVLGGLSKQAGLPQMKLGWMVVDGNARLCHEALERLALMGDTYLSVGTPVMHALPGLLACADPVQRAILGRVRENLRCLRLQINAGSPVSMLPVEGGWYGVLRLPRTRSEEAWVLSLLDVSGVYVHPGHFFDFEREAYVVVSLLTPPSRFADGVRRLVAQVERG